MQIIYEELIVPSIHAENAEDAIRKVGKYMLDGGFVKETYIDAVIAREVIYPTGLQLKGIGIAMPHTDKTHVNKPAICIAHLNKPVKFAHMGEPGIQVETEMLFMMAIQNPNEQIDSLQKVLSVFGNEQATSEFKSASTKEELYAVARKYIG